MMELVFSPQARNDPAYIQQLSKQVYLLVRMLNQQQFGNILEQSLPPTLGANQSIFWVAKSAGTLDGTTYSQGDVLYTTNKAGTQKTLVVVGWNTV